MTQATQTLEKKRLETLKWEFLKVRNWLVEGRVIYAHRHAKAIVGQFSFELDTIHRLSQMNRMISRIRRGEIIDAHNDIQSLFDFTSRILEQK